MGFSLRVLSLVCALMPFVNARGREYDGLDLQCLDATLVQTCDDILTGMQLGLDRHFRVYSVILFSFA